MRTALVMFTAGLALVWSPWALVIVGGLLLAVGAIASCAMREDAARGDGVTVTIDGEPVQVRRANRAATLRTPGGTHA